MRKLFNFRILLFVALSVCLGIFSAYLFYLNYIAVAILLTALFLVIALTLVLINIKDRAKIIRNIICVAVCILCFALSLLNLTANLNSYADADLGGGLYSVKGEVLSLNQTDINTYKIVLSDVSLSGKTNGKSQYKIAAYLSGSSVNADVGDVISFSATLQDKGLLYENSLSATDIENGIKYTCFISVTDITVIGQNRNVFQAVNIFLRDTLKCGLSTDTFSIGYALLTGDSSFMDGEVLTNFRSSGVAHIFAVSGLHIGFLAVALNFLLKKCRVNKYIKAVIVILALFFYSGVCGFSASSVRAAIMCSVTIVANLFGKKYDSITAVSLSAIIVLFISPVQLFCVGFQLSFAVVIGIILLSKPISNIFKFLPKKIASSLGVVLSAQIVSIPILLYAFNQISIIAVIANLFFIPLVAIIFLLLLLCTLIGGAFSIPVVALFVPNLVLTGVKYLITAFDYTVFAVGGFSFGGFVVFYYLALLFSSGFINLKKIERIITVSACGAVCLIGTVFVNVDYYSGVKAYIIGTQSLSATLFNSSDENVLVINSAGNTIGISRLKRATEKCGAQVFDSLIILNDCTGSDVQEITTAIRGAAEIEKVYYFGEEQPYLNSSFPSIEFYALTDGQSVPLKTFESAFILNGKCLSIKIYNRKLLLFAEFGSGSAEYISSITDVYMVMAVDYLDQINAYYKPTVAVSHRKSAYFTDAESAGNLLYKFGNNGIKRI